MKNKILFLLSLFLLCCVSSADVVSYVPVMTLEGRLYAIQAVLSFEAAIVSLSAIFFISLHGIMKKKSYKTVIKRLTIVLVLSVITFIAEYLLFAKYGFHIEERRPSHSPKDPHWELLKELRENKVQERGENNLFDKKIINGEDD